MEMKGLEGLEQLLTDNRIIYAAEGYDHKTRVYLFDSGKVIGRRKEELAVSGPTDSLYTLLVGASQRIQHSETLYPCEVDCTNLECLLAGGYGIYFSKVGNETVAAIASSNEFDDPDPIQLQLGRTLGESFSRLIQVSRETMICCQQEKVTTYRKTR